ncbi:hypothetical protein LJR232_001608 [Aquipseudomonas alcaligenes]|uniref:YjbH domain-containing protein n=1 Tax=Pseudomonas solani TaxID=2731552 RepID=A0AAU7Y7K0_9PSED
MNLLKSLLFTLGLGVCSLLQAAELSVLSGTGAFGLPASATRAQFVERLGKPTAELPMYGKRRGLLYGNSMMLVFLGDRLREVRCWELGGYNDSLFLGWMQGVGERGANWRFSLDGQLHLGQRREQTAPWLQGLEGTGDERSDVVYKNGSEVWLGYGFEPEFNQQGNEDESVLVSITVHFNDPR